MKNATYRSIVGVVCLAIVGSSLASAQDKVVLLKGATAIGKIEEITRDQVTINVKSKNQNYKTNEIARVVFDDEPNNLETARSFLNNRQFNLAEAELKKVDMSKLKDERVTRDVQFYKAFTAAKMALSGMGSARDAAKELSAAHKAEPQSYHAYKAAETLGELATALNLPDLAAGYYNELAGAPFPEMKALAAYKLGEVALTSGKLPQARKMFDQLLSAQATDAEMIRLKNLAEVGLVVCDAREGKSQEALTKLQELVKKNDSSDQALFARIYNAQGVCYEALGQTQQALLAYLRTDLLFSSSPDLHAEALYHLTQLWPKVGQPQRSTEARQQLTSKYPSSPWSNKQ